LRYGYFKSLDGLSIRYGIWETEHDIPKGIIILLGGRAEYLEKHLETVDDLTSRGFNVYGMDWRGQGLSTRVLKNRKKGFVGSYDEYVKDLYCLFNIISECNTDPEIPVIFIAHSMGGHICLRFLHDHPNLINKAVLVSPMIDIFSLSFADRAIRKIVNFAMATGFKEAYVIGKGDKDQSRMKFEGNPLTSDYTRFENRIRDIQQNPDLALGGVTYGWLNATFQSIDLIASSGYVEKINTPVLCISASNDKVVSVKAQLEICSRLPDYRFISINGALHEVLHEKEPFRLKFLNEFDKFVKE